MNQAVPSSNLPPRIPDDIETADGRRRYFNTLTEWMNKEFARRVQLGTPQAAVLLASPNGSVYNVTVSDAGVLTTTLVYQKT